MSQGHLRQRGNSWELKFDIGRDPVTGQRRTRTATFRGTVKGARARLRELLSSVDKGEHVAPSKVAVADQVSHADRAMGGGQADLAAHHRALPTAAQPVRLAPPRSCCRCRSCE